MPDNRTTHAGRLRGFFEEDIEHLIERAQRVSEGSIRFVDGDRGALSKLVEALKAAKALIPQAVIESEA